MMLRSSLTGRSLEFSLGNCKRDAMAVWPPILLNSPLGTARDASMRRRALELMTGRSLEGFPLEGFDYQSILGQCCEMPIGYVQIPLGVAGPLLVNGFEYMVSMATTEWCLVASTNRGCKAILMSSRATSILLRDGMTRAPVVRFQSAKRAADLKYYLEDPTNSEHIADIFNRTSKFARLQGIQCAIAGKNLYMRFSCSTGDAMGMNMVSKGVQNVLDFLQSEFPDMDVISVFGNLCADKKPKTMNWIEGRGKSIVCEAVITEVVVNKVLKTTVPALLELNMLNNLTGSAMAGAMGGFNAHATNIVSVVFIATDQDPYPDGACQWWQRSAYVSYHAMHRGGNSGRWDPIVFTGRSLEGHVVLFHYFNLQCIKTFFLYFNLVPQL